jgi:hypothetical protein
VHAARTVALPSISGYLQSSAVALRSDQLDQPQMTRISHEIFDNKGGKRRLLGWLTGEPVKPSPGSSANGSTDGSAGSPAPLQAETSLKSSEETAAGSSATSSASSPASSPESTPANGSDSSPDGFHDGFPPLIVVRIGDTVRINRPPDRKFEWSNEDFACLFLRWLATEYPACRNGGWVSVPDIDDEFFVRFQEAAGCHYLEYGALYQGLGKVTQKRERQYKDCAGKRCSMTEYKVPRAASNVVDLAAAERKRA